MEVDYRAKAHVEVLERRRNYLQEQLQSGDWKGKNAQFAINEADSLTFAINFINTAIRESESLND